MLRFLDIFFLLFHTTLILFNLTGWIREKTKRLHLFVISATLLSWFGLGIFFGWGYCPCTDWHWKVKQKLGETNLPSSYIKYYADLVTSNDWDASTIDAIVVSCALVAFVLSIGRNKNWF